MKYTNPILPGMYPDPSVCRVGEDYYLVTSTFEYLPGVPVFTSRDLVHWRQIGHVIDRPEQLDFSRVDASGGIYAPTIRYHDGVFYMVTTAVVGEGQKGGNFMMTAERPEGPWSAPVWLDQSGIDPSLFFDEDGTCYLTSNLWGGAYDNPVIQQSMIDPQTGEVLDGPRVICHGAGGCSTEAPHLYRRGGLYYLLLAEGGTALGHMVTAFRSASPWGPFESCPDNPILTARDKNPAALCATGHADLVTTQHGETFMVFLCYRHATSKYHHLGRETALLPVDWADGWPRVRTGRVAPVEVETPSQLEECLQPEEPKTDTFTQLALPLHYNFVRAFVTDYTLHPEAGELRLTGGAATLSSLCPSFIGRRQRFFDCEIRARLRFDPQGENEEAGVALRMSDTAHYAWVITRRGGQRVIVLRRTVGDMITESTPVPCPDGETTLVIRADRERYAFGVEENGEAHFAHTALTRLISTEVHWGFVGVYAGMYATGNGVPCKEAARFTAFSVVPAGGA